MEKLTRANKAQALNKEQIGELRFIDGRGLEYIFMVSGLDSITVTNMLRTYYNEHKDTIEIPQFEIGDIVSAEYIHNSIAYRLEGEVIKVTNNFNLIVKLTGGETDLLPEDLTDKVLFEGAIALKIA